ncbi:MAG: alpha-mannosidase [Phormidium sp. SL48-SHIP]|nr:MAG: alpha-mannosidase [Phormidium sp. SL48-SHIP]
MTDALQPLQDQLQSLCRLDVLNQWRQAHGSISEPLNPQTWLNWQPVTLNERGHIPWRRGKQELWLSQTLVIPKSINGFDVSRFRLYLSLRWWADFAQLYLNGILHRTGDLFDCFGRILLDESVQPGQTLHVALYLVSPSHDDGALVTSDLIYENEHLDPGFVADELAVCRQFCSGFFNKKLNTLVIPNFELLPQKQEQFLEELQQLHEQLNDVFSSTQGTLYLMGHAHLDMAWLWEISETWTAAQRTFKSVLNLQTQFPELVFSHSSAALYDWIECHRPDLFASIKTQVERGVWEVAAGLWVEPELNLISGESIVRQILYGQQYVLEKFGQPVRVAWLPDSFGFCWQLPQLLKQGGIDYFVTQKLRWNDTTEFPYDLFWWESPDGTRILSLMSAPIGQGIEPQQMASYLKSWQDKTGLSDGLWLPGVGDHGGGPTRDMLEVARRWQGSSLFPKLAFSSATDYLDRLQGQVDATCPVWRDELYLQFHRGCYTTEGDRKRANREGERCLYQAEVFASLATITAEVPYPGESLEKVWKDLLFNQFHDILPGSTIPEVLAEANRVSAAGLATAKAIRDGAIMTLLQGLPASTPPYPEAIPVYVVNALTWSRSQVVSLPLPNSDRRWRVCNLCGEPVPSQRFQGELQILAEAVPGVGCARYWLYIDEEAPQDNLSYHTTRAPVLENANLRATIDAETGNIQQIFDKRNQQELLNSQGGNQLQAFRDQGQYWDAWNIDPNYEQYPLNPPELECFDFLESGNLRQRLRVVRRLGESRICQDYILDKDASVLVIETEIDWQERQVLLKTAFNFAFNTDIANYDMACGTIARPTQPQTPAEAAKWEVPALQWADLSTRDFGVSLLQNCKHGYDAKPNQLRLTLLRGCQWPNPESDRGIHHMTYAISVHPGDWKTGKTDHRADELNQPLRVYTNITASGGDRPPSQSHQWLSVAPDSLKLMALKASDRYPNQWILRVHDRHGEAQQLALGGVFTEMTRTRVNLLDETQVGNETIAPWQIASFRLQSQQNLTGQ